MAFITYHVKSKGIFTSYYDFEKSGQLLVTAQKSGVLKPKYSFYDTNDTLLFEVQSKFSLGKTEYTLQLDGHVIANIVKPTFSRKLEINDENGFLTAKYNLFWNEIECWDGGTKMATIYRNWIFNKYRYEIEVSDRYNKFLIFACIVIIEDMRRRRRS